MKWKVLSPGLSAVAFLYFAMMPTHLHARPAAGQPAVIHNATLSVESQKDGSYALHSAAVHEPVLESDVDVETANGVLRSSVYPQHLSSIMPFEDELGAGQQLTVTNAGLPNTADLICEFRLYANRPWGDIRVQVRNTTGKPMEIHAIHVIKSVDGSGPRLNGPDADDRILSDSFSEDTPQLKIMDL